MGQPLPRVFSRVGFRSKCPLLLSDHSLRAALLGLNTLTARIVNLLFGFLILPLLFVTTRRLLGAREALISTLLLAVLPWNVMASRWGLESNLLPFFLLLGVYTTSRLLSPQSPTWMSLFAFVPWALALYTYGTAYVIVPGIIILLLITHYQLVRRNLWRWLGALAILFVIALPLVLFTLNNYVLHSIPTWESSLPFSAPLLLSLRTTQIAKPFSETLTDNFTFLLSGFQDNEIWNADPNFPPLPTVFLPFLLIGAYRAARKFFTPDFSNLFLLWLIACLPLIFLTPLNITRANAFFIPILVLSALGFTTIYDALSSSLLRAAMAIIAGACVLAYAALFAYNYFVFYPNRAVAAFQTGLVTALEKTSALASPSEKFYVTSDVPIVYNYVLFSLMIPPQEFQTNARYDIAENGTYVVKQFGRFYFEIDPTALKPGESFVYVQRQAEPDLCPHPQPGFSSALWKTGRCTYEP